jgi:hypothetical protein
MLKKSAFFQASTPHAELQLPFHNFKEYMTETQFSTPQSITSSVQRVCGV